LLRFGCKVGLHETSKNLAPSQEDARDGLLSASRLTKVKQAALRRRVWFRVLSRLERDVLDLTTKYVNNVKSALLAKVLTALV
jgi:hypothetical protein